MPIQSGTAEYYQYLESPEWRERRRERIKLDGNRCRVCNQGPPEYTLHVHHRSYHRLAEEDVGDDLTTLCTKCHDIFHRHRRVQSTSTAQDMLGYHGDIVTDSTSNGTPSYEEILETRRRAISLGLSLDATAEEIRETEKSRGSSGR